MAIALTIAGMLPAPGKDLGDVLRKSGWDRIVGTWVDADTRGGEVKAVYAWKFENKVVEVTSTTRERETTALMALHPKTGDVVHVGADDQGGGSTGKWKIEDGDAVLEVKYVTADGDEGEVSFRHHFEGEDTLVVTIEGESGESYTVTLVREKLE